MSSPSSNIEDLLAHAEWLRRLARHLVRGQGDGEDAVQDTWLAALRSPPRRPGPAQPWLAEVLRNFVRRAVRGQRARQARETLAEPPELAATPETNQFEEVYQ